MRIRLINVALIERGLEADVDIGSIDVTIDSGNGGWSFRPDHLAPYDPSRAPR